MIQARGLDFDALQGLPGDLPAQRDLCRRGVAAGDPRGDVNAQLVCQGHAHQGIANQDLVAQADHLDPAVPVHCIADAHHRVGEIDQPGLRAELLHIARDLHDRADVAGGVGEAARAAVFGIRLAHAKAQWDFIIHAPERLTRRYLDREHDKACPVQRLGGVEYAC